MDRTDDKTSEHREAKTKHRPRYTPILRTVLCNRWILVRSSDLIQLMNVTQVRIVRISRHRLFLELLHVPVVVRHDIITVIFLRHVLLLKLMLMVDRRVTIHDSKLLILAENVADAERGSGDRGRQHSNAFSSNVDDSCEYSNDELHFPMLLSREDSLFKHTHDPYENPVSSLLVDDKFYDFIVVLEKNSATRTTRAIFL